MNWSRERWRKLYLRESVEQRLWSVVARGVRDYLLRLAEDDGALIRDDDDPIGALVRALGTHAGEAELVRAALELLRRDGFLAGGQRSLFIRNLGEAQGWEPRPATPVVAQATTAPATAGLTSTERVRRHRARLRGDASGEQVMADAAPGVSSADAGSVSPVPESVTSAVPDSVSSPVSSVTSPVSSGVSPSRGLRNLNPSGELRDIQKNSHPDLLPSDARAERVTRNVSPTVPSVSPPVTGNAVPCVETGGGYEEGDESFQVPRSREEALGPPVGERARLITTQPALAAVVRPESWPEVVRVAQAFAAAAGIKRVHLGRYDRDPGVRALVELYAAGYTQSELEDVVRIVPRQPWWSENGKRLGLSSLSIEVVRRNLPSAGARPLSPQVAKVLESVRRRREAG